MHKVRVGLILSLALIAVGFLLAFVGFAVNNFDYKKFETRVYQTNTCQVSGAVSFVQVTVSDVDVTFAPATTSGITVESFLEKNVQLSATVQNGVFTLTCQDNRKWYEKVGIGFRSQKIIVYLPVQTYQSFTVKGRTCDVTVQSGFAFGEVNLSLVTGDVDVKGVTAESLAVKVRTGVVELSSVVTTGKTGITTTTGDVELSHCDAGAYEVKTTTGDVEMTLLSAKNFNAKSSTGRVRHPQSEQGANPCNVTSRTGDVEISVLS